MIPSEPPLLEHQVYSIMYHFLYYAYFITWTPEVYFLLDTRSTPLVFFCILLILLKQKNTIGLNNVFINAPFLLNRDSIYKYKYLCVILTNISSYKILSVNFVHPYHSFKFLSYINRTPRYAKWLFDSSCVYFVMYAIFYMLNITV